MKASLSRTCLRRPICHTAKARKKCRERWFMFTQRRSNHSVTDESAWIITAGNVGKDKQAIALSEALGLKYQLKNVVPSASVKWLFPVFQKRLLDYRQEQWGRHWQQGSPGTDLTDLPYYLESPLHHSLAPPFPKIVFSSCQDTTLAALQVCTSSAGRSFGVHLHQPFVSITHHDAIVLPRYLWPTLAMSKELKNSEKIIPTDLHLTNISPKLLATARSQASNFLPSEFLTGSDTRPLVAVLLRGGRSKDFAWYSDEVGRFTKQLQRIIDLHNGRVLLTLSHRSSSATRSGIMAWLEKLTSVQRSRVFLWDQPEPQFGAITPIIANETSNTYNAILACATHIAVSADSITMISEALMTRKPTYIIGAANTSSTLKSFVTKLLSENVVRKFVPSRIPSTDNTGSLVGSPHMNDNALSPPSTPSPISKSDGSGADIFSDVGDHPPWRYVSNEVDKVAQALKQLIDHRKVDRHTTR
ncbi:mitochondrial fission ELM1-domain-containing protein [Gaertneriomyces semiglobifer]|nr:mitochondrial fission ELM1-domain-containing protein [Gaertneriomyces semiglobifer]